MLQIFVGYDHRPPVNRATLYEAAKGIGEAGLYRVVPWEDLRIQGQLIIQQITQAIDASDIALFDLTTLNPNVLFELGYAIARKRRIGILLEKSSAAAATEYKRYGLLRPVGYFGWTDRGSIIAEVMSRSFETDPPLGESLVAAAGTFQESSLLFMPARHQAEPDTRVRGVVRRAGEQRVQVITADPGENRMESLNWYASKSYSCAATLLHFESPNRTDHAIHNGRLALVGGMAHGFGRPLLMLADEAYEVPLDYKELLRSYSTPKEAEAVVSAWLEGLALAPSAPVRRPHLELAVELRSLNFGEHVAENEIQSLPSYFIPTAQYREVLTAHLCVFVGRKGTGKSANLYLAASELSANPGDLVVVVRPTAYDFEGLVELISKYSDYTKSYAIDGIWKLLLLTEIARVVADELHGRPTHIPLTPDEQAFLDGVSQGPIDLEADFGSRIDSAINSLRYLNLVDGPSESNRDTLNEALHTEWIRRLRKLLTPIIGVYDRVAILIDNLDKGWERSADLPALSDLLLGLLGAVGRVEKELTRELGRDPGVAVTLALFLRSDIFGYVKERAREPDKIVTAVVEWTDPEVLRRVVEQRFLSTRNPGTSPDEMWDRFFCQEVKGIPTREYLTIHALPRPRDLIFLCNAAVGVAINRGHARVEEGDILSAEEAYSQFAFEALLVENGITVEEFEAVLLEFLGVSSVLTKAEILDLIHHAGIADMKAEQVLSRLRAVSFLGIETAPGRFEYPEIGRPTEKAEILARKNARSDGGTRYAIHPAYRAYLNIAGDTVPV